MNDFTWIAPTILALASFVTSVGGLIILLRQSSKMDSIEKKTDGMTTALVAVTKAKALTDGHAQGVKDEKVRRSDKAEANKTPGNP